jgi:hypothetical protein
MHAARAIQGPTIRFYNHLQSIGVEDLLQFGADHRRNREWPILQIPVRE